MEPLENLITQLPGFKISNSHFKIGSKLHISDFYYAKRFFQNGFFASRIAFWLAKDIITTFETENRVSNVKREGLTIVGYEMYSELLISIVDKFLRKKWELNENRVNHNLYEDFDNLRLCKRNNILGNVVIVVPIASTFSTSIKIENHILNNQKEAQKKIPYIMRPHLNVLHVSDGIPTNQNPKPIEKMFSWKEKNIKEKTIEVEAIYSGESETIRPQKYYLSLPTKWHNVEDCQLCNPTINEIEGKEETENLEDELPLYETDRTAVTPAMIFDFPEGRSIDDKDLKRKIALDTNTVTYGHHTRNNKHFLYSIDTEAFLEKNKEAVQKWLLEIKNSPEFRNTYKETDRVIVVSSCHFSNAAFVTLVNDFLFASSANIIHYDPINDYVQNFKIVYGKEMSDADRIFFVDDSLKSGAAFNKIYQFIQNTFDLLSHKESDKRITGCFFLVNKSQAYVLNDLKRKLINSELVFAFANLHLYTSLKPSEISPLQIEQQRYKELMSNTFIDSLKVHFQKQFNKLLVNENTPKDISIGLKADRHLEMLIATHRIYQYFSIISDPNLITFYEFLNDLLRKTSSPLRAIKSTPKVINDLNSEEAKAYLKVIAQLPFTQYKPLKDKVFKWVIQLLIKHVKDTEQAILEDNFDYDLLDTLKFLIRRAGLLNSNILISRTMIEFIPKLYSSNGIPKIVNSLRLKIEEITKEPVNLFSNQAEELKKIISKLNDFHIFYAAQIKELLLRNESRCLRLEKMLKYIEAETNPSVKQLVRILREENSLIIKVFYEYLSNQAAWGKIYVQDDSALSNTSNQVSSNDAIDYTNDKIADFLSEPAISHHHKFQTLDKFFIITNQPIIPSNKIFLDFLWIQYFLSTDKNKKISLNIKTEFVVKKMMQIFIDSGITGVGAFFIVNDSRKKPFIAFNRNYNGKREIDENDLVSDDNQYLMNFFQGEDNSFKREPIYKHSKTLIELKRNPSGEWIDLFATTGTSIVEGLNEGLIPDEYNRLILIRLNKRSPEKLSDKAQGIIGFYYHNNNLEIVNINILRYLLLLRYELSRFIENHHENDEFTDWQIAEIKQRTSLLTGHGREMLINVALDKGDKYKSIVYTLLTIQRLLIDKKEESESLNFTSGRIKKMFETFFQVNSNILDELFFEELAEMAIEIFTFEEIENQEELETPVLNIEPGLAFRFDKELLNMICFEIFVNAKKNRWLFSDEDLLDARGNIYNKNKIWIDVKQNQSMLNLQISSTGPKLRNETLEKIRTRKNIKRYDNSSGIELINTILSEFNLGNIDFNQDVIVDTLVKFTVTITLQQNDNRN
ncbi:MAG TPA: hypothetical protein VIL74_07265 [Pyrinomonadaceae bacterium]|jgi:hypothetical protein